MIYSDYGRLLLRNAVTLPGIWLPYITLYGRLKTRRVVWWVCKLWHKTAGVKDTARYLALQRVSVLRLQ